MRWLAGAPLAAPPLPGCLLDLWQSQQKMYRLARVCLTTYKMSECRRSSAPCRPLETPLQTRPSCVMNPTCGLVEERPFVPLEDPPPPEQKSLQVPFGACCVLFSFPFLHLFPLTPLCMCVSVCIPVHVCVCVPIHVCVCVHCVFCISINVYVLIFCIYYPSLSLFVSSFPCFLHVHPPMLPASLVVSLCTSPL